MKPSHKGKNILCY